MAIEERLPPACAFAVSVLAERDHDPDAVPEEAVEAALQHIATCPRCREANQSALPRKKRKGRRVAETAQSDALHQLLNETSPLLVQQETVPSRTQAQDKAASVREQQLPLTPLPASASTPASVQTPPPPTNSASSVIENAQTECQLCRQLLPEYVEVMESGQNVGELYPEIQAHLLTCEAGCLLVLDLLRQEAKATRKYRRRPVRDPFSAIGWEASGFFRGGQVPMSAKALSYGTLLLLLLVASLSAYAGITWEYNSTHPTTRTHFIPTPDGIGLSDGLKVYDACNAASYRYKREAAQQMQTGNTSKSEHQLLAAMNAALTDTTGCNGAEAAIYHEDLRVRQSGHPFAVVVVSFDSGPGVADPQGGTDRHILYAAYTQELIGAFIAQQRYNDAQIQVDGTPLLYLVLANTTGVEQGALQVANTIATLATTTDLQTLGLLAQGTHPLLGVLGLGPSSLVQVVLPVLCRAGVPLIVPTATGLFIVDLLQQTSLYRHCTPGFAFVRFSPDDQHQSLLGANYAYKQLHVRNAAIFYDPSNPSSLGSVQGFRDGFSRYQNARIVAQETAVASGLLDANGHPQASRADLLAGLNDALQARPRPDMIFAPLLTNDVITLAQAIAKLPQNQQPILMIGGEFVQPTALQTLVQWARQKQLTLPRVFVSLSAAARPPSNNEEWQKQFYSSFCTSFATPGSYCSGTAALDQGALFFADGIEIITRGVGRVNDSNKFPTKAQLVQRISMEKFAGVSCPIALRLSNNVLVTSTKVQPVILGIQPDGSIQIMA